MERFNYDANTIAEAREYMLGRARQLLRHGYMLVNINEFEWGISAYFEIDKITFQAIYLLKDYRGKGLYKQNVTHPILTSDECNLKFYLFRNSIPFVSVNLCEVPEYKKVQKTYGNRKALRSNVELINHIDEGLFVLTLIGASEVAKRAYCLHPIVQGDKDLKANIEDLAAFSPIVCMTTVEYRSVANDYLSMRDIQTMDDIRISPLDDVNDMLIADKMQNRKDFDLYHKGTHERSKELDEYFTNWFKRLNISDEFYNMFCETLNKIEKWNIK